MPLANNLEETNNAVIILDGTTLLSGEYWDYSADSRDGYRQVFVRLGAGVTTATVSVSTALVPSQGWCQAFLVDNEAGPQNFHFYLPYTNGIRAEVTAKSGSGSITVTASV